MEVEGSDVSEVADNEDEHGTHDESSHMDNDPLHNPPTPHLSMSKEQLTNMMQAMVTQQMEQQFAMQRHTQQQTAMPNNTLPPKKRKRKVLRSRRSVNCNINDDEGELSSNSDSDQEGSYIQQSAQTARRILWQRGHQHNVPSKVQQIISAATVTKMSQAWKPLSEIGFAIIEDMTEVFAPKYRCTMEQRDYIHKCTFHHCTEIH